MDENDFQIEGENTNTVILHLLINLLAQVRSLTEFVLTDKSERTGESIDQLFDHHDKSAAFHKAQVLKSLYESFSSLKDILPPEET
jgi:hypothetical protein